MRILIQKCCKMNASSSNEFAPLHLSAFKGDFEMVALLLDHLALEDVDAQGKLFFYWVDCVFNERANSFQSNRMCF